MQNYICDIFMSICLSKNRYENMYICNSKGTFDYPLLIRPYCYGRKGKTERDKESKKRENWRKKRKMRKMRGIEKKGRNREKKGEKWRKKKERGRGKERN
ncbi:hypothetical protein AAMO2058_000679700 [Amorphochlora amoebiformis]